MRSRPRGTVSADLHYAAMPSGRNPPLVWDTRLSQRQGYGGPIHHDAVYAVPEFFRAATDVRLGERGSDDAKALVPGRSVRELLSAVRRERHVRLPLTPGRPAVLHSSGCGVSARGSCQLALAMSGGERAAARHGSAQPVPRHRRSRENGSGALRRARQPLTAASARAHSAGQCVQAL
jgi:hypothetical protein